MTSDDIKEYGPPTDTYGMWLRQIALQSAIQSEQQAETLKLMTRSVELQELVHLARPAELETLRKRVDELLNANNAEVERRRQAEREKDHARGQLEAAEQHIQILKDRLAERSEPKRDAVGERDPKRGEKLHELYSAARNLLKMVDTEMGKHHEHWVRLANAVKAVSVLPAEPRESTVEDIHG